MSLDGEQYMDQELDKNKEIVKQAFKDIQDNQNKKDKEKVEKKKTKGGLDNPKKLRNIRSISMIFISVILPFLYFMFFTEDIDWMALISFQFGFLILFTTIGTFISKAEVRKRAFEDTVDENENIYDMEIEVNENGLELNEYTIDAIPVINAYNDKLQNTYDLQKTSKIIIRKKRKIAQIKIAINYAKWKIFNKLFFRYARIKSKEKAIDRLNYTPKRYRRFKPYKLSRLLTSASSNRYKPIGDAEIKSNPSSVNVGKSLLKMPFKGIGTSLTGGVIPIVFGADVWTIFTFYVVYVSGLVIMSVTQYILTKYKTETEYRLALDKKKKLQEMILKEVKKQDQDKDKEKNKEE